MSTILPIAGAAALASVLGGLLALIRRPTSLAMSIAFGFASGVLISTVTLEMVPQALELTSLGATAAGFTGGFLAVWMFDLFVNRWQVAGEHAAQWRRVEAYHRSHRPRGDRVTVLAGGTSAEELVEGLAIGTGVVIDPEVGALVAAAIAVDNFSEGLSIGELVVGHRGGEPRATRRVLGWTGLVGASLLLSALLGWLLLRDAGGSLVGLLQAVGAGGMLYLTVSALVPPSEEQQYQGSGALATGAGFLVILFLTEAIQ
jgi:ZIP family zinc transporter